jgi:hypothetical protein
VPLLANKNLPSTQWDGRDVSRGTTQISRVITELFALTFISLSYNVENTVRTICGARCHLALRSHERLERELRLVSVERGFQPVPRASLTTSANVLSSVLASYGFAC